MGMMDPALGGGAPPDLGALLGGGGGMEGGAPPPEMDVPEESAPSGDPVEMMRQALDLTRSSAESEPDDEDQAELEKIGAAIAAYIGKQQKLVDTATGAGPGAKLVRKSTAQSAAGGGGGEY